MLMLEIYYNKDDGAEYLIYLTNWTYMVLTGVSITDFVITAYVHLKRKDIIDGMYDRHTVYMVKGVSIKDCYSVRTVKSRKISCIF